MPKCFACCGGNSEGPLDFWGICKIFMWAILCLHHFINKWTTSNWNELTKDANGRMRTFFMSGIRMSGWVNKTNVVWINVSGKVVPPMSTLRNKSVWDSFRLLLFHAKIKSLAYVCSLKEGFVTFSFAYLRIRRW